MIEDYGEYKALIEEYLVDYLPEIDDYAAKLSNSIKYSLQAGGKRLRPILLMAACEFAGGSSNTAMPFACAIEYIHTYSLIHDDLPGMDDDDLRRGKPTNHKVFGEGHAILAGDGLLNSAFEIMTKNMLLYMDNAVKLNRRVRAMYCIAKAAGVQGMIGGQSADLYAESAEMDSSNADILYYIHENKTASLIVAAVRAGLYLGGADEVMMEDLTKYAKNLGMAFQIYDDILDVIGDEEKIGKQVGSDKAKGKTTFVSEFGLEKAKEKVKEYTDAAIAAIEDYYDNAEFFRKLVLDLAERTN